jgi:hypothetical protein
LCLGKPPQVYYWEKLSNNPKGIKKCPKALEKCPKVLKNYPKALEKCPNHVQEQKCTKY